MFFQCVSLAALPPLQGAFALAKFRNAGQTCICPNRVYVQEGSRYGLDDYLHTKYICHDGVDRRNQAQ